MGKGSDALKGVETRKGDPKFYLERETLSTGPEGLESMGAMAHRNGIRYNFRLFATGIPI
jgi:hypothetical protein